MYLRAINCPVCGKRGGLTENYETGIYQDSFLGYSCTHVLFDKEEYRDLRKQGFSGVEASKKSLYSKSCHITKTVALSFGLPWNYKRVCQQVLENGEIHGVSVSPHCDFCPDCARERQRLSSNNRYLEKVRNKSKCVVCGEPLEFGQRRYCLKHGTRKEENKRYNTVSTT